MASKNKKKKLHNSHLEKSFLKNKTIRIKGIAFFTPSQRKMNKKVIIPFMAVMIYFTNIVL